MRKIKKVMDLLRVNWRTMAEFEILYKVLSMTIFTPLFLWAFNGIMKVTGYQYLTIENVVSFFLNPLTILAILLLTVCMAVYSMVDVGAVIFLLDQSYQGKKADLVQTVRYACISILFYGHKEDRQEEIIHGEAGRHQEKEKRRKIRYAAEGVILLGQLSVAVFICMASITIR